MRTGLALVSQNKAAAFLLGRPRRYDETGRDGTTIATRHVQRRYRYRHRHASTTTNNLLPLLILLLLGGTEDKGLHLPELKMSTMYIAW